MRLVAIVAGLAVHCYRNLNNKTCCKVAAGVFGMP